MLKIASALIILTATTQAAGQDNASKSETPPAVDVETPVFDPDVDTACDNDPQLVQGAEGDAQLFRDPARPDTLQPMHAVGYEVDGCSLLVMTDGSLMRPPQQDEEQPVSFMPAQ
ncbi:hypothetical protein [Aurantiacibacter rhizosphaerae]|uniref:Secreted protein n=1 Tax=Aurantiacibacter rhizosphaerae TaxID=2691582 RepID=A0A844XE07_9SPHN|nr:hypothetical protein [Aurantiacibacter rhizosphaerae]MWV27989.1 hypothetical protein [Aurantiacibacter rhizosphaerae]